MKKFLIAVIALGLFLACSIIQADEKGCLDKPDCREANVIVPDGNPESNLPPDDFYFMEFGDEGTDQNGRKCEMRPWVCKKPNSEEEDSAAVGGVDPIKGFANVGSVDPIEQLARVGSVDPSWV